MKLYTRWTFATALVVVASEVHAQLLGSLLHVVNPVNQLLDPLVQPINVNGVNSFQPPNFAAGDVRGPCPGLNALANHGYIPHNGVTTLTNAVSAINQVFGMGIDLGTLLSTMGTVWTGNPLSLNPGFSIGGPTTASSNILSNVFGLVGTPQGLIGSHNWIESDSSNTRNDLYMTGDASTLQLNKFIDWYNMSSDAVGNYNMDLMALRAITRWKQTVGENPNFYYGPVSGMVVRNAGYYFAGRMFANYSSTNPNGVLTKEIIKDFYGISGSEGHFTYRLGWETIPQNWYRIPADYGLAQMNADIVNWVSQYPDLGSIGGNTGTINSFTGLDIGNLTGGVYNAKTLLQGNNLICFAMEVVKVVSPGAIAGLYTLVSTPLNMIANALAAPLVSLACPAMNNLQMGGTPWEAEIQKLFPGAKQSGGGI